MEGNSTFLEGNSAEKKGKNEKFYFGEVEALLQTVRRQTHLNLLGYFPFLSLSNLCQTEGVRFWRVDRLTCNRICLDIWKKSIGNCRGLNMNLS